RRCADGAGLAVVAVRTVRGGDALEVVALHDTRGALALAGADHVDQLARLEGALDGQLLAERVVTGIRGADLGDVTAGGDAGCLEVGGQRLGDLAGVDLAVGDLNGVVAVLLGGADLGDHVGRQLDDGDRNELAALGPHLGHAELGAEHALGDLLVDVSHVGPQSLISMLTSAGRSRRISESTALGVGSTMSIRRLWVRISKCSRLSLYLWGERITAITFFSVGSGTGPTTVAPARVTVSTILRADVSMTSWSYDFRRMRIFCPAIVCSLSIGVLPSGAG